MQRVNSKYSVLIVDDHPLFREGLKATVGCDHRFQVVAEAGSGRQAIARSSKHKPDLALVDLSLPDMNGIQLIGELKRLLPEVKVLVVSMHADVQYIVKAFKSGASGYVVKGSAAYQIRQALESLARGDIYVDDAVAHQFIQNLSANLPQKANPVDDAAYESLTAREKQVFELLAEGFSVKNTATKLSISPKTVENHRSRIMDKLNLRSTFDLVRYAVKLGMINTDLWKS